MNARILSVACELGDLRIDHTAVYRGTDELELGISVSRQALSRMTGTAPINAIIFATSGIRPVFPSGAIAVAAALGLKCATFDVTAGCTAMNTAVGLAARVAGTDARGRGRSLESNREPGKNPTHGALRCFADGAAAVVLVGPQGRGGAGDRGGVLDHSG